MAVADPIKTSSFEAIEQLKKDGMTVVMVTGDNHTTAAAVARKLGIEFEADVLPGRKDGRDQEAAGSGEDRREGGRWGQ
jgi:Cu+-exporting ATPase